MWVNLLRRLDLDLLPTMHQYIRMCAFQPEARVGPHLRRAWADPGLQGCSC